ncbi:MAG TPA: hypothetical protein VHR46_02040 [Gaiella sp.]|nr:hypothetical protein [Gaiella sp.]
MPTLTRTIPALPVRDAAAAVGFYRDRLGFAVLHHDGVDELYEELRGAGALHPVSQTGVDTDFGTREFATLGLDGNLVTFFRRVDR